MPESSGDTESNSKAKKRRKREVYHHFTCATDTDQIGKIFRDVTDSIIKKTLQEAKLY